MIILELHLIFDLIRFDFIFDFHRSTTPGPGRGVPRGGAAGEKGSAPDEEDASRLALAALARSATSPEAGSTSSTCVAGERKEWVMKAIAS